MGVIRLPNLLPRTALALALAALAVAPAGCGAGSLADPGQGLLLPSADPATSIRSAASRYVPGQVIVRFKPGTNVERALQAVGGSPIRSIDKDGTQLVRVAGDAEEAANQLKSQADFAEPNYIYRVALTPRNAGYINQSKYLGEIKLPQAWNLTLGGENVVVAVIDTGVDMTHPDLIRNMVPGYNVLSKGQTPIDDNGHGTHVAGIIAAGLDGTSEGAAVGVAPQTKVMPIKALDAHGNGNTADIAAGIIWAVDHGARILNLSLGGGGNSRLLSLAVQYALNNQKNRAVVVAAMGNGGEDGSGDGINLMRYPAAYPGVVSVGALNGDRRASFSDWGRWISVSAPGYRIYSTTPTRPVAMTTEPGLRAVHDYMDGTSMATPIVSGVVALLLSRQPQLTPALVKQRLETTATDVGAPGRDDETGYGRINAFLALN